MKKILFTFGIIVLVLTMAACKATTTTTTAAITSTTATTGTTATTATTVSHTPVTLTYAAWNLGDANSKTPNLERLMLKAFEQQYPWITVNVIEIPNVTNSDGSTSPMAWDTFLAAQAAKGQLPDVFMEDDVPDSIINGWNYDLTSLVTADPEFSNIAPAIQAAQEYDGHYLALPMDDFFFGYFVDKTLFDQQNVSIPQFGISMNDLIADAQAVASMAPGDGATNSGIVGMLGVDRIFEWYPALLNPSYGWFTYDGTSLHLDSTAFAQAMALQQSLLKDKTFVWDALTPAEQTANVGTKWAFGNGQVALNFDESSSMGWIQQGILNGTYNFDEDFIGTPSVNGVTREPVTVDELAVSSTTKNPQDAYLLAKWMGFGSAGYAERINLSTTTAGISPLDYPPLQANNTQDMNAFFNLYPTWTNFRKVVESNNFIVEPVKYLPGYINARYSGQFDANDNMYQELLAISQGQINLADVATQLNTFANSQLTTGAQAVDKAIEQQFGGSSTTTTTTTTGN